MMENRALPWALGLVVWTSLGIGPMLRAEEPKREVAEKLVSMLGSDQFDERNRAYRELVLIGPPALPLLRGAAKSENLDAAPRAANCVEEIERVWHYEFVEKQLGLKELPDLLQATKDERPYVRASAASMLAKLGEKGPNVMATYLRLLRDDHVLVRRIAANCSGPFISQDEMVCALMKALNDKDRSGIPGEMSVPQLAALRLAEGERG